METPSGKLSIEMELLLYSYWEHYGMAKSLEKVLPLGHPKRVRMEKEINIIAAEMEELRKREKLK